MMGKSSSIVSSLLKKKGRQEKKDREQGRDKEREEEGEKEREREGEKQKEREGEKEIERKGEREGELYSFSSSHSISTEMGNRWQGIGIRKEPG